MKKKNIEEFTMTHLCHFLSDKENIPLYRTRILIVCEGEKAEPNYFRSFKGASVDVITEGVGKSPVKVVRQAITLSKVADADETTAYDSIWVVFDKKRIPEHSFNAALSLAEENGIECAWSDAAFELWFLLHFREQTAPITAAKCMNEITKSVKKKGYKYTKNDKDNHILVKTHGSEDDAISRAEHRHNQWEQEGKDCNRRNPCTTVYKLVKQLLGKDSIFNEEVSRKLSPPIEE